MTERDALMYYCLSAAASPFSSAVKKAIEYLDRVEKGLKYERLTEEAQRVALLRDHVIIVMLNAVEKNALEGS